ncbi:MAG: queuosine precursor transporter [Rickettsiaceae bacterium]
MNDIVVNHGIFCVSLLALGACTLVFFRFGACAAINWITVQAILANIIVIKQIDLLGMHVTAADALTVSSFFSLTLLQEVHGKTLAKSAINISIISLIFFALVMRLHLLYKPNVQDFSEHAYQIIFGSNVRIIISSILAYYISQSLNSYCYFKLTNKFPKLSSAIRVNIPVVIAQMVDTIIFSFLGLYGLIHSLWSVIIFSSAIKLLSTAILSYLVLYIRNNKFIKNPRSK